jgi:hypothetical protein
MTHIKKCEHPLETQITIQNPYEVTLTCNFKVTEVLLFYKCSKCNYTVSTTPIKNKTNWKLIMEKFKSQTGQLYFEY